MADEKGGVCSVHTALHSKKPSHRFQGYVQNLVGLPQSTDIFWSSQSLLERERYAPTCCCAKGLKLVCWNIMLDAADSINTLSQVSFPGISSSKSSGLNTPYIGLANQWKRDTRGGLYGQNLHCFKLEIMPIGHSDHTIFMCTPLKDQVTFNCNLCSLISLQMTKSLSLVTSLPRFRNVERSTW